MLRFCLLGWLLMIQSIAMAEVKVLTSIKPLQLIAAAITDNIDNAKIDVLLPAGASAHHYSMRPSDIERVQTADLFYWVGPDMEVFLVKALQNRDKKTVAIYSLPNVHLRSFTSKDVHDDHDHEHQAGSSDLHLWLSTANAKIIAKNMATDLIHVDPANKALYEKNLLKFNTSLDSLDKKIKQQLTANQLKPFFVLHETYDYFEEAYGIKHQGVFSVSSSVQPGVQHVAEMQAQLKQAGDSCVFYEPPMPPKLASTLVNGLPAQLVMLDAMGDNIELAADGYTKLLDNLLTELLRCKSS